MNSDHAQAIEAVTQEQQYQLKKWGNHIHSPGEWVLILGELYEKARREFYNNGHAEVLHVIREIAATALSAMEQQGVEFREMAKGVGDD